MDMPFGAPTYTGKTVSVDTSLQVGAVWACIQLLSRSIAKLPLMPVRILDDGHREPARDHNLWVVLTRRVNPETTAFRWKQLMQAWVLLWGNAYSELIINGRGQVVGFLPWRPDRTTVTRNVDTNELSYHYKATINGVPIERHVPSYMMLHLRGLSVDGYTGLSPIMAHKQAIGLSLAIQEHGARFFANGARPLGVLQHPTKIGTGGMTQLREDWAKLHGGLPNAHRIAILEEGMQFHEVGMKMVDAQFAELYQLTVGDIARIFGVQPHKIGELSRSTNDNIQEQGLEYDQEAIDPWVVNWEAELNFSLLSDREAQSIECAFDVNAIMRMNPDAQSNYFQKMWQTGAYSANDIRRFVGENPIGPEGDIRYVPVNYVPVGTPRTASIQVSENARGEQTVTALPELPSPQEAAQ
jgi:HK97 family phage portal protein